MIFTSFAGLERSDLKRLRRRTKLSKLHSKAHKDAGRPYVAREAIAQRIVAAARTGEHDPVRLREAALRKPD